MVPFRYVAKSRTAAIDTQHVAAVYDGLAVVDKLPQEQRIELKVTANNTSFVTRSSSVQ